MLTVRQATFCAALVELLLFGDEVLDTVVDLLVFHPHLPNARRRIARSAQLTAVSTQQAGRNTHRVVVIGGGFGGLQAVRKLRRAPVEVTIVDRRNFHLFQPLTYQVATGALSAGEIAYPLRAIFKRNANVRVLMAEVADFDLQARALMLRPVAGIPAPATIPYDTLIVAGGSQYSYFGHDEWREHAAEVKSLESALVVRTRLLSAFEAAEGEPDPERAAAWLTFVVVGAGPTGVEMAGQIAELARDTLRRDFSAIDPRGGRILLVEAGDRILATFPPSLSEKATRSLEKLGVTVLVGRTVVGIEGDSVIIDGSGAPERIASRTVVWAAGVTASGLAGRLAELTGAERDTAGRVTVEPDLTLPGHPEVFALGDMVRVRNPDGTSEVFPGVAPVAMQQGRYAGSVVRARLRSRQASPFRYRDKGNLATIGRAAAVADIKGLKLSGFIAWLTWLLVHLFYLVGFQNRILVFIRWAFSFVTRGRGARLIVEWWVETPQGGRHRSQ
jgi:NADH:quinone reductase (non-electrogenic)